MGLFSGSASASPDGGGTEGGGILAKLFREHADELRGGSKAQYTYDPNTQQYTAMKKGGKVSSASARADGIAQKGKTRGKFV